MQAARVERDLLRFVADALEVRGRAEQRHDEAQVARRRMSPRNDLSAVFVDGALEPVHFGFVAQDLRNERG